MPTFLRFLGSRAFFVNLSIALVGIVLLGWATLTWLDVYTAHGQEIRVPVLKGFQMIQARDIVARQHLNLQITDSLYVPDRQPGEILEQDPLPNSTVKENRIIYVSIVSGHVPKVSLPPLLDLTLRQAELTLGNVGLKKGKVIERSDIASTHVLEAQLGGKPIAAGTLLPKGATIDLVVGMGATETETILPDLTGYNLADVQEIVSGNGLNVGNVEYLGAIRDSSAALVVKQDPAFTPDTKVLPGTYVNIWLR